MHPCLYDARMADPASGTGADGDDEFLIDGLAAHVGMTVRNVRAYAGRGILPPPRLEGRTGYYGREHVQRLGRILRPGEDKQATLYEVVAADTAEVSTSQRRRRHDAYR